jgi:hypothetical protein
MKPDRKHKLDLTLNPITGLPNEGKRYYYPKADAPKNADDLLEEDETSPGLEIDDTKIAMMLERLRWRGARKIRGYRFKGTIPAPKHATDYLPWLQGKD